MKFQVLDFFSIIVNNPLIHREIGIYGGAYMPKATGTMVPNKAPAKGEKIMKKGEMPAKGGKGCDGCGGKKKGK